MSTNKETLLQLLPGTSSLRADNTKNWVSILLALIFFVIESVVLYAYIDGGLHLVVFCIVYVAILAVLGWNMRVSYTRNDDIRYPALLFYAALGGGPFGLAGFLILALLYPLLSLISTPFSRWLKDLFPTHQRISENVYERIKAGWDDYKKPTEVTPFMDIFNFGTLVQKQSVLDAISKDFVPSYSNILKRALSDQSNIIRIHAAAIVAKIEFDSEERLKKLLREHNEDPQNPQTTLALAQHLDTYAFTGLLDSSRELENQQSSLTYYNEYLKDQPNDLKAWLAVGRLLFRKKDFKGVLTWFDECHSKFEKPSGTAYSWYLEALYMLKEYSQLELSARPALETMSKEEMPREVVETVKSWEASEHRK